MSPANTPVAPASAPASVRVDPPVSILSTSSTISLRFVNFIPTGLSVASKKVEYSPDQAFSGTTSTATLGAEPSTIDSSGTTFTSYAVASGLTSSTTYYFRASVTVGGAVTTSDVVSIRTSAVAPLSASINTIGVAPTPAITTNTITIRTTFFVPDGASLDSYNAQYTIDPTFNSGVTNMSQKDLSVPSVVTGGKSYMMTSSEINLTPGTTYYFRAVITVSGAQITSTPPIYATTLPQLLIAGIEPLSTYAFNSVLPASSYNSTGSTTNPCDGCKGVLLKGSANIGPQGFTPTNTGYAIRMRVYFKDYPTTFQDTAYINAELWRDSGTSGTTGMTAVGRQVHYLISPLSLIPANALHYVDVPLVDWTFSSGTTYYILLLVSGADGTSPGPNWTIACKSSSSGYKSYTYDNWSGGPCATTSTHNNTLSAAIEQYDTPYIALYNY